MSEKFQENVTVLKQQCIGKDIYDMTIQTKHIAGHAKAGQFVSLYSNDASKLLPRPISLCGIDAEAGTLRLVYRVTGEGTGTEEFSRLKAGDTIRVLGPLGNGFTVEPGKKAFLIGGGIGIPPMLELAKSIKAAGTCEFVSVMGYRDAQTFLLDEFKEQVKKLKKEKSRLNSLDHHKINILNGDKLNLIALFDEFMKAKIIINGKAETFLGTNAHITWAKIISNHFLEHDKPIPFGTVENYFCDGKPTDIDNSDRKFKIIPIE